MFSFREIRGDTVLGFLLAISTNLTNAHGILVFQTGCIHKTTNRIPGPQIRESQIA